LPIKFTARLIANRCRNDNVIACSNIAAWVVVVANGLSGIPGVGIKSWLLADLDEVKLREQNDIQNY
jgi:hypothetical protein